MNTFSPMRPRDAALGRSSVKVGKPGIVGPIPARGFISIRETRPVLVKEVICGETFFRWRIDWTEPDVVNHKNKNCIFLGRMFKLSKAAEFEYEIFAHDIREKFHFVP